MKRKSLILLLIMLILSAITIPVFAESKCGGVDTNLIECDNIGAGSIRSVLLIIINVLSIGVGIIGVIGISVAGIQYLTAGGDEQKTTKAKRRIYEIIIGVMVFALMWTGAQWLLPGGLFAGNVEVINVSLGSSSANLTVGDTKTLSAILEPLDADNESLTWKSSDSKIATVDDNGKIVAKSDGDVVISVTTSNGTTTSMVVSVKKPPEKEKESNTAKANEDSRHKIGSALAGLHSNGDGDADLDTAINKKYYAVECDFFYAGGNISCSHDSVTTKTNFLDLAKKAKQNGVKVIIDHVDGNATEAQLRELGTIIKNNDLQDWVLPQTARFKTMDTLNSAVGKNLEYWGLAMSPSVYNSFISKAGEYKQRGMTTVNIPDAFNGFYVDTNQSYVKGLKDAGYNVSIFSWVSFEQSHISTYGNYGVKYLMTSDANQ